ncbi:MAG: P-type conjugative transfer protein TrbG [Alphaproteobacteria bacterium]|nr:P-type conjugative transfer protein TrbG [Alphaproteobacteria bacterium]
MHLSARHVLALLAVTALSACAVKPPHLPEDSAAFKPAKIEHDPAPIAPVAPTKIAPPPIRERITPAKKDPTPPIARVEAANKHALLEPRRDGFINAVQIYPFSANALYRLYAAPEQVSDIVLQPGETLSAISAGDTVRWTVGDTTSGSGAKRCVHVLVKPFEAGLKTNLVILTDRRTYHLELQSTPLAAMAAVSWTYPNDELIARRKAQAVALNTVDRGVALHDLHFDYAISGDQPSWRPLRAFDDGHKVYIEFPAGIDQGEAPPLFVVGADGDSDLVNYRMRGRYYVVDRLFAAAELRLGQDPQQIVRITRTDDKRAEGTASLF